MPTLHMLITDFPILSAAAVVALLQSISTAITYNFPEIFPIEWADIFSLVIASLLTIIYYHHSAQTSRQFCLLLCVLGWAFRLSVFLASRIRKGFHDKRLDTFRGSKAGAKRWLLAQSLWISVTLLPVWIGMAPHASDTRWNVLDFVILTGYMVGLVIETVADAQKAAFLEVNSQRETRERRVACDIGLFRYSRFPNYFGEWLVWTSLCLAGWQAGVGWTRMLLPICSWFVLNIFYRLSIPLAITAVRKRATDEQFKDWCKTSLFVPMRRKN